jgi:hypothetical protein
MCQQQDTGQLAETDGCAQEERLDGGDMWDMRDVQDS